MSDYEKVALFLMVIALLMMTPSTIDRFRKNKIRRNR